MQSSFKNLIFAYRFSRYSSSLPPTLCKNNVIKVNGQHFTCDEWTNVTEKILSYVGKNLHMQNSHPLSLIKQRIVSFFYKKFIGRRGNPIFSVYENLSPVVSVDQNFNSLLIPKDHPSRTKGDCYYINKDYLLRAHATAHQVELMHMGLDNFLIVGDVYRRDEIDSRHYPVFHQLDAVRLLKEHDVCRMLNNRKVFEENGIRTAEKQEHHTVETSEMLEKELKSTLSGVIEILFGKDVKYRWVETYFPFTHPSWELEVFHNENWIEILGCGVMEQKIVQNAGVYDRVGWAFGVGLERLAMCLFSIPDIRLFWSTDTGFLSQFSDKSLDENIKYEPVSIYPQCINDISFWLPEDESYAPNDFYDIVREIGGDIVEQGTSFEDTSSSSSANMTTRECHLHTLYASLMTVDKLAEDEDETSSVLQKIILIDEFVHPKKLRKSHCYRIVYRHMEKTLTQEEVSVFHQKIGQEVSSRLNVNIR